MKWNEVKKYLAGLSKKTTVGILAAALVGASLAGCASQTEGPAENAGQEATASGADEEAIDTLLDTLQTKRGQSAGEAGKEETVYIFADSTGKAAHTLVSGWLKNPEGLAQLTDQTQLEDLVNVKGEEGFEKDGDTYLWKADGRDIYYQGTTTKEAPVKERITYYLDGKEIAPDKLAGKSGEVKIRFDYENTCTTKATVNGKEEELAVPFAVVTGMILNDRFQNIRLENARLVSDGKNNIVVGFALPGLYESLRLDDAEKEDAEKIRIPDYVEVCADVEDFSMDMTLTVVSSSADLSFEEALDFSELDEKMETLTDSSAQLADGTQSLTDGIQTLRDSMGDFADGVSALQNGITEYTDGAGRLAEGIVAVYDGAAQLDSGAIELEEGIGTLNGGVAALKNGIDTASGGAGELANGINGAGGARNGARQLAEGANALKAGFDSGVVDGSRQVADGVSMLGAAVKTTLDQVAGMNDQLLEQEVAVVKQVYAMAGKGDVAAQINKSNVSMYGKNIGQIVESVKGQLSGTMTSMLLAAREEEAVQGRQAMQSLMAMQEAKAASEEAKAKEEEAEETEEEETEEEEVKEENGKEDGTGETEVNSGEDGNGEQTGRGENGQENTEAEEPSQTDTEDRNGEQTEEGNRPEDVENREPESVPSAETADENAQEAADRMPQDIPEEETAVYFSDEIVVQADLGAAMDQLVLLGKAQGAVETIETLRAKLGGAGASMSPAQMQEMEAKVNALVEGAAALADGIGRLYAGADALASGASQLDAGMEKLGSGADELAAGLGKLGSGGSELQEGAGKLLDGSARLTDGTLRLKSGALDLQEGAGQLTGNSAALREGADKLSGGTRQVTDGVEQLYTGSGELLEGMVTFDREGIRKIADVYNGDVKSLGDRMEAIFDAGTAYDNFCGKQEGTDSSVKFIIRTEGVKQ